MPEHLTPIVCNLSGIWYLHALMTQGRKISVKNCCSLWTISHTVRRMSPSRHQAILYMILTNCMFVFAYALAVHLLASSLRRARRFQSSERQSTNNYHPQVNEEALHGKHFQANSNKRKRTPQFSRNSGRTLSVTKELPHCELAEEA